MSAIGVIDDRDQDLENIVDEINLAKNDDGWTVVADKPFPNLAEYSTWISEKKICALIVDERLNEEQNHGVAVGYTGHELVDYVRERFKTLPIYVITAHSNDFGLQERFKDVEDIIVRREFGAKYNEYVTRIIRAAQQYLNIFQEELNQLSDFAYKAATGESLTDAEKKHAEAIQTKLEIAYSVSPIADMSTWLDEASVLIDNLEKLRKEVEKKIGEDK